MVGGVRKLGAWSEEEDSLLRKCIEKYGEGKWHQVPLRAGLRRCRKSCRLRWLNYLRPNIKRGNFSLDEVDLIIRLHKLLGNRWSLIAGRLPGRTSNDVKNYWNTHQTKKSKSKEESDFNICKSIKASIIPQSNIVKPRPRTFTRPNIIASLHYRDKNATPITTNTNQDELIKRIPSTDIATDKALSSSQSLENSATELFKGLFQNEGEEAGGSWPSGEDEMNRFWLDEIPTGVYEGNITGDNDKEKTLIWDNDVNESAMYMDILGLLGLTNVERHMDGP